MRDVEAGLDVEPSCWNGWTAPPSTHQAIVWLVLVVFADLHFTTLVPTRDNVWQPAAHILPGVVLFEHMIVHLATITINSSGKKVRVVASFFFT
ncbi:hypothetical protein DPMN_097602 [Dreissena polymorpha]|uniref:Uncharacterized protein n=1 Tax=Dreissena polymorpha TaxID=45954 RepID=A0A9D4LD68_DREPO|nr:hypothetical protein DPMN_097602 [Dreissena polymorpha]